MKRYMGEANKDGIIVEDIASYDKKDILKFVARNLKSGVVVTVGKED